jgi:hypothetical protein
MTQAQAVTRTMPDPDPNDQQEVMNMKTFPKN